MLNRALSFIAAAALLLAAVFNAAAADAAVVSVGSAEAKAGETVVIDVSLTQNTGVGYIRATLLFDQTRLEFISAQKGELGFDFDVGKNLLWSSDSDVTASGTLAKLTFRVLPDAPDGEAKVSLTIREAYSGEDDVPLRPVGGAISVGSAAAVTETPTQGTTSDPETEPQRLTEPRIEKPTGSDKAASATEAAGEPETGSTRQDKTSEATDAPKLSRRYGDADGDGAVTPVDARLILRAAVKLETFAADADIKAADIDRDGQITAADARLTLRKAVGAAEQGADSFEL